MQRELHLVYSTDSGYLIPTFVSVVSAIWHVEAAELLKIHILDTGIPDEDWIRWKERVILTTGGFDSVVRHKVDVSVFSGCKKWRGGLGSYARLLIPSILNVDWCLYCDGDTLFTDDPLKVLPLFDDKFALIGHIDGSWYQQGWYDKNGLVLNRDEYVCAGVLMMNLDYFRKNNCLDKCLEFLKRYPITPYVDQDVLNNVCSGHIRQLRGVTWGALSEMVDNSGRNPGCIHYAGRLPSRMNSIGLVDVCRLWFWYARRICGLSFRDCGARSTWWRYACKVTVAKFFGVCLPVLRHCPQLSSLCHRLEGQYFTRQTWRLLTK